MKRIFMTFQITFKQFGTAFFLNIIGHKIAFTDGRNTVKKYSSIFLALSVEYCHLPCTWTSDILHKSLRRGL